MQLVKDYIIAVPDPMTTVGAPQWNRVVARGPDVTYAFEGRRIMTKPGSGVAMVTNDGSKLRLFVESTDLIGYEAAEPEKPVAYRE